MPVALKHVHSGAVHTTLATGGGHFRLPAKLLRRGVAVA